MHQTQPKHHYSNTNSKPQTKLLAYELIASKKMATIPKWLPYLNGKSDDPIGDTETNTTITDLNGSAIDKNESSTATYSKIISRYNGGLNASKAYLSRFNSKKE